MCPELPNLKKFYYELFFGTPCIERDYKKGSLDYPGPHPNIFVRGHFSAALVGQGRRTYKKVFRFSLPLQTGLLRPVEEKGVFSYF